MNALSFDASVAIAFLLLVILFITDVVIVMLGIVNKKESSRRFILSLVGMSILFNVLMITVGVFLVLKGLDNEVPRIVATYPSPEAVWDNYDDPLIVEFNTPVEIETLDPSINPQINGTWEWEPYLGIPGITKSGKFIPSESTFQNQRVVVYVTGISRPNYNENHEFGYVFESVNPPSVVYSEPYHNEKDVPVDSDFTIYFDKENIGNVEWQYTFIPEVTFNVIEQSPTQVLIDVTEELLQSQEYILTVKRKELKVNIETQEVLESSNFETNAQIHFTTVKEPLVRSFTPSGTGVKQDQTVRIRFEVPMDRASVENNLTSNPFMSGRYVWNDNSTILQFMPDQPLPKDTKYEFTFNRGLQSINGGISKNPITFKFETIGPIKVTSLSPTNGEVNVREDAHITVSFDQEVDKESAQSKFSISPSVGGSFSWPDDKTMVFIPSALNYNTTYTATVNSGIKTIYGLDSTETYSTSFTIRSNQIVIGMPQYFQPQSPPSFSCNVYAARMALAWKGYNLDIVSMIAEMGYNDNVSGGQWQGNPYVEYVGNYDGSWGYGVYWGPIQRLFTNRGIQTEIHQGWNLSSVAQSIQNGAPVVIWRYNGESANYDKDWVAADGTYIDGINGQHGSVVAGFRGTPENPTHFFLNDPWYGQFWIESSLLDYYWSRLGRVGLVVH